MPKVSQFPLKRDEHIKILASLPQKKRINNHVACVQHVRLSFHLGTTDCSYLY